ncbi:MAG: cytochrome c maturation protein CcmE [Ilumatobacteraceae bacterium]
MDLSPRTSSDDSPVATRRRKTSYLSMALIVLVILGGAVIVTKFLTSAIDYYCNVDEVGVRDGCEPGRQLRVQGTVDRGSLSSVDGATAFSLSFNNKTLHVLYSGQPGGIFQECIPVVVQGRLVGGIFEAVRIEVKHSNEYVAANEDRIKQAEAEACSQATG